VSARAAVARGVAFVPDWSGRLCAVKSGSGKLVWSRDIASYTGAPAGRSGAAPSLPTRHVASSTPRPGTTAPSPGTRPATHVDSVLALHMTNGSVAWADRFATAEDWTVACFSGPPATNCPVDAGPDFGFGSGVRQGRARHVTRQRVRSSGRRPTRAVPSTLARSPSPPASSTHRRWRDGRPTRTCRAGCGDRRHVVELRRGRFGHRRGRDRRQHRLLGLWPRPSRNSLPPVHRRPQVLRLRLGRT
jgi:hypothetical protein